jgi:PAS domain-containing protein
MGIAAHADETRVLPGAAIALCAALATLAAVLLVLRRARDTQRRLWALTGEGLARVGLDGRIRTASDAFGLLVGREPDALAGTPLADLVHSADREPLLATVPVGATLVATVGPPAFVAALRGLPDDPVWRASTHRPGFRLIRGSGAEGK